ncbi:MAG: beta-N-acetylhexosaminidase [Pseudomonadota bacterium]
MTTSAPERTSAAIFGCSGLRLTDDERAFFRESAPWGFILFARNVGEPDQVRALVDELRDAAGWRAPVLIDQEGGRVARLKAPHWREWPAVGDWCAAADASASTRADAAAVALPEEQLWRALSLRYQMIGAELRELGVDVDCMPLLDVRVPDAHDVIGDRALGFGPEAVAARGTVICDALLTAGVLPVVKHLPGHGRAFADSHEALPVVDASIDDLRASDFAPFRALRDQPLGMTAHVVYTSVDSERCATISPIVINDIIRTEVGFDGLLMTDDLSMKALSGDFATRARESLAAGCDLALHCNGVMSEMLDVMHGVSALDHAARRRSGRALSLRGACEPLDLAAAEQEMRDLAQRFDSAAGDVKTGAMANV